MSQTGITLSGRVAVLKQQIMTDMNRSLNDFYHDTGFTPSDIHFDFVNVRTAGDLLDHYILGHVRVDLRV